MFFFNSKQQPSFIPIFFRGAPLPPLPHSNLQNQGKIEVLPGLSQWDFYIGQPQNN